MLAECAGGECRGQYATALGMSKWSTAGSAWMHPPVFTLHMLYLLKTRAADVAAFKTVPAKLC